VRGDRVRRRSVEKQRRLSAGKRGDARSVVLFISICPENRDGKGSETNELLKKRFIFFSKLSKREN